MRSAGRVNLMLLGAIILVVLGVVFFFAGRNGPSEVANQFMSALGKGNVDQLVDLTYLRGQTKDELRAKYKFATQEASPYYSFTWSVVGDKQANDDSASVQMKVWRNAMKPGVYPENFQIPMVKSGGRWLVDVGGINSEMYPALPR